MTVLRQCSCKEQTPIPGPEFLCIADELLSRIGHTARFGRRRPEVGAVLRPEQSCSLTIAP
jgi:hypothetical protein